MPLFKIYNLDGEKIYDSFSGETSENLEDFIVNLKGEEFWDNVNLESVKGWEELLDDKAVVGICSDSLVGFESYSQYVDDFFSYSDVYNKINDEIDVYVEDLRQELVSKVEDNVIDGYEYEKIKEKYKVEEKDVKTKEKGQEKEVTKDEFEREF